MHVTLFIGWSCELLNASRYDTGLKLLWKISFCVLKHTVFVNLVFAHMPLQLFHFNIMNFWFFLTDSVAAIYVNVFRLLFFLISFIYLWVSSIFCSPFCCYVITKWSIGHVRYIHSVNISHWGNFEWHW